ncbi:MAG: hypothetical protein LBI34_00100 [Puniceicoccales bacterium]|jgi:hypothetical protein|nr:hypothetical protein [Puniceicoccales bacterium]
MFFDLICRTALIGITFLGFYFTAVGLHNSFLRESQKIACRQNLEICILRQQVTLLQRRIHGLYTLVNANGHTLPNSEYSQKIAGGIRR